MMNSFPKLLYKYQPCTIQNLCNLIEHKIWISTPDKFNDPFDVNYNTIIAEHSDAEIGCVIKELPRLYPPFANDLHAYLDAKGMPTQLAKEKFKEVRFQAFLKEFFDKKRDYYYGNWGVACFSARKNRIPMWSHYADSHKGFCLEFDTSHDPFQWSNGTPRARKVCYPKKYPHINFCDLFTGKQDAVEQILTTKPHCFAPEREFRIIFNEGNKPYPYDPKCLTAIYFGVNMNESIKRLIINDLRTTNPDARFWDIRKDTQGWYRLIH